MYTYCRTGPAHEFLSETDSKHQVARILTLSAMWTTPTMPVLQ